MITKYSLLYSAGATKQQIETAANKLKITPEELLTLVNNADPTNEKKFEAWLIKQLVFRNIILPEDQPRVLQTLQNFMLYSNKKLLKNKDINGYKKIHDLESEIDSLRMESFDPREKLTIETLKTFPGVEVFEGDDYVIAIVSNIESLEILGLGTKWCTRQDYPGGSLASVYLRDSFTKRVYIMYTLEGNFLERKYQFEDSFDQVMDESDQRVGLTEDMVEDIQALFNSENIPLADIANAFLQYAGGNAWEAVDILQSSKNLDKDIVKKYFKRKFENYSGEEPNTDDYYLAGQVGLYQEDFSEYPSLYNNDIISSYFYYMSNTAGNHSKIEAMLLNPAFFEDRWESLDLGDVLSYYKTEVLTSESVDPEEQNERISKWKNFIKKVLLSEDDYRIEKDAESIFEAIKITKVNPKNIAEIKEDSELYSEYVKYLKSEGYIPDLIEHDWGVKEQVDYLGGK
jgi:hypothetical protein